MSSHAYIIWICVSVYAIHLLEKVAFDWRNWMHQKIGVTDIEWSIFYVSGATVIVTGIAGAMTGWNEPAFALILPAVEILKAIIFYLIPLLFKQRLTPGIFSALLLFLPVASWAFAGAYYDDVLSASDYVLAYFFGAVLMFLPMIFYTLKKKFNGFV
jgi:hypothetical protein